MKQLLSCERSCNDCEAGSHSLPYALAAGAVFVATAVWLAP